MNVVHVNVYRMSHLVRVLPSHFLGSELPSEFIVESREEQHTEQEKWKWEETQKVPPNSQHLKLSLRPYCTYRFRVITVNEVGRSDPSEPSDSHRTPPAGTCSYLQPFIGITKEPGINLPLHFPPVPDQNPSGVRSESTDPDTLLITWDVSGLVQVSAFTSDQILFF